MFDETDQAANSRIMDFSLNGGVLSLRKYDDNSSNPVTLLRVNRATGNVGIGSTPDVQGRLFVQGNIIAGGNANVTDNGNGNNIKSLLVNSNITSDGVLYGALFFPTRSAGTAGALYGMEGYLSNSPHTSDFAGGANFVAGVHVGISGDARSDKGVYTGTINIGVQGIANLADKNVAIYG
ncbi:MAG: hypothetical protein ACTS5G_03700, partial [Burkholderiales bacterium]